MRRNVGLILAITVAAFTLGACRRDRAARDAPVGGELDWTTGDKTVSSVLNWCDTGQKFGFFGVVLASRSDPRAEIRMVEDPLTGDQAVRITWSEQAQPYGCYNCTGYARGARPNERVVIFRESEPDAARPSSGRWPTPTRSTAPMSNAGAGYSWTAAAAMVST